MWLNLITVQLFQYLSVFKGESAVAFSFGGTTFL